MTNDTEFDVEAERLLRDERFRLAELIEENAATIAAFAADAERAVLLVALMMRLGEVPSRVAEYGEVSR